MNAFLMYRQRDFDLGMSRPFHEAELIQDLELDHLFDAMARTDPLLRQVARTGLLCSLTDPAETAYRQQVLRDCIRHPGVVRELYGTASAALEGQRKIYRSAYSRSPELILLGALDAMDLFLRHLRDLRTIADRWGGEVESEGLTGLFRMLRLELDDAYLEGLGSHVHRLRFRDGVRVSASLGRAARAANYRLHRPPDAAPGWRRWLAFMDRSPYTLVLPERDESGARALSEIRRRGLSLAARAVTRAADDLLAFFGTVRAEAGFYLACLNLRERLAERGQPVCIPQATPPGSRKLSSRGLYDVALSLVAERPVIGNDLRADGKALVVITGANQGGKSTFLRSVGTAHLMMQAGMFVGAEEFHAAVCSVIATHYPRREDPAMRHGKLDEELSRMSALADHLGRHGLVLFNESFSATNEREGAEIAAGIVSALMDAGLRVFFVTHSFELADTFRRRRAPEVMFLRAERSPDGRRTFRVVEGEPLPTSFGEDVYRRVFADGESDRSSGRRGGRHRGRMITTRW